MNHTIPTAGDINTTSAENKVTGNTTSGIPASGNPVSVKRVSLQSRLKTAKLKRYYDLRCTYPRFYALAQMPLTQYFKDCPEELSRLQSYFEFGPEATFKDAAMLISILKTTAYEDEHFSKEQQDHDIQRYYNALVCFSKPLLVAYEASKQTKNR